MPLFVVLYGNDDLMTHCLGATCRHAGVYVFSTNEGRDVHPVIEQCVAKGGAPVLVLDAPVAADSRFTPEALADLRRTAQNRHPHLSVVQLAGRDDLALPGASADDVVAMLSRPRRDERPATFAQDFAAFLAAFPPAWWSTCTSSGAGASPPSPGAWPHCAA